MSTAQTDTKTPILDANNIKSGYGQAVVVHDASVNVFPGEIVTIIGPNGSGKSTFLKAVFGLLPVFEGELQFKGKDVRKHKPSQMVVDGAAFVPQTDNVFVSLSIMENLQMGAFIRQGGLMKNVFSGMLAICVDLGRAFTQQAKATERKREILTRLHKLVMSAVRQVEVNSRLRAIFAEGVDHRQGVKKRAQEILALFPELERRPRESAANLSGGQRQSLALGRAMMLTPQLMILDEPTAALAPKIIEEIFNQIKLIRDSGVAILMVEQNAEYALNVSDRAYVMVDGKTVLTQSAREMLKNSEVGKLFLGH